MFSFPSTPDRQRNRGSSRPGWVHYVAPRRPSANSFSSPSSACAASPHPHGTGSEPQTGRPAVPNRSNRRWPGLLLSRGRERPGRATLEGVARIRFCDSCGARLPRNASARRRYCDDVCRAQAYRARQTSDRIMTLAMMLADAEWNDDTGIIRLLTCPECGQITFAGGHRRQDAVYCSGRCRSRAWRRRAARRARRRA